MNALWAWITDHATVLSAVLSAISALIVAVFTGCLFWATSRQGKLLRRSIDLSRDEFQATHRPKIIIREVFWDPEKRGNISVALVNCGTRDAEIKELVTEFGRTDERPIMPAGANVTKPWVLQRGAFEAISLPIGEQNHILMTAFEDGRDVLNVTFQGLLIYSDDRGTLYRSVFKRICRKGSQVFVQTENPDDEYSD